MGRADDDHRWDASLLFDSVTDWEDACDRYEADVESFDVDESVAGDAESLRRALERRDDLVRRGSRLRVYAELRAFEDTGDEDAQARVRRVAALEAKRDAALESLTAAVREAGRDRVDALLADRDALATYDHYLDDVFRRGAYALESATEDALAELEESLDAPARTLRTLREQSFEPPTVQDPDGEDVVLSRARRNDALTHPDRGFRRRVYDAYREELRADRAVAARAYADHLRRHAAEADLRGYESVADADLDGLVPAAVRETLVSGVREESAFREPYERRREHVDGDLRPWDLRAPLADATAPEIPYEDAVDLVVDAVAPLGDDYQDRLAAFLAGPHVDAFPREDKREIPAVMFGKDGTPAFVHLNYEGTLESLFLFAHELGHAMHYLLAREAQPDPYQRLSWYAGELPSFLHELLLARSLLDGDRVPDGAVLDTVLGRLTPVPAARGAAFTHRVVDDVQDGGAVTADDVDAHFRETGREFFAPATFTDADGHRWLALNLDREPFHAYYYAVGRTAALAAGARLREGALDAETYREFLRAGDSAYPVDLLTDVGVDLADDATVGAAAREYGRFVERL